MIRIAFVATLLPLFAFAQTNAETTSFAEVATIRLQPPQPKVGQRISAIVQVKTKLERKEVVPKLFLGSVPLSLESESPQLFLASLQPFTEIKKDQILRVELFTRDAKQAERIHVSIRELKREIRVLENQLLEETDPQRIIELENRKNELSRYLQEAEQKLDALNVYFQTLEKTFQVEADPENLDFPLITSITPNAVVTGKRTKITISGERFGNNPTVKMGDQNATIISANASTIEVLGPNFSSQGLKEVEVRFPVDGSIPRKNAIKTDSLFATSVGILQNLRPVAVTTGYVRVIWPVSTPIQLNGSNSYDENGDLLSFLWEVVASPAGSSYPAGTLLADSPTPSITPDRVGIFRVRLRVKETNTEQEFQSFASIVTIEVK